MSVTCFYGVRLEVGGPDQTPTIPVGSRLVITQAALSADSSLSCGRITLNALGYSQKQPLAIATLNPQCDVFHTSLSLLFTKAVTFSVSAEAAEARGNGEAAKPHKFGRKKKGKATEAKKGEEESDNGRCVVELIGYYEMEDSDDESDDDVLSVEDGTGAAVVPSTDKAQSSSKKAPGRNPVKRGRN